MRNPRDWLYSTVSICDTVIRTDDRAPARTLLRWRTSKESRELMNLRDSLTDCSICTLPPGIGNSLCGRIINPPTHHLYPVNIGRSVDYSMIVGAHWKRDEPPPRMIAGRRVCGDAGQDNISRLRNEFKLDLTNTFRLPMPRSRGNHPESSKTIRRRVSRMWKVNDIYWNYFLLLIRSSD